MGSRIELGLGEAIAGRPSWEDEGHLMAMGKMRQMEGVCKKSTCVTRGLWRMVTDVGKPLAPLAPLASQTATPLKAPQPTCMHASIARESPTLQT